MSRSAKSSGSKYRPGLGLVDQMMMWIDDRQVGLEDLFMLQGEPFLAERDAADHDSRCRGLDWFPLVS